MSLYGPAVVETVSSFRKGRDLDGEVRRVTIDGVEVIELRDVIPSLGEDGRGYWFPKHAYKAVAEAILRAGNVPAGE